MAKKMNVEKEVRILREVEVLQGQGKSLREKSVLTSTGCEGRERCGVML